MIRRRTVGAELLHVHAEKADVGAVDLLKREQGFGTIGEYLRHQALIHKPETRTKSSNYR